MYTASLLTGDLCSLPFGLPGPADRLEQAWAQQCAQGARSQMAPPVPACRLHPADLSSRQYENQQSDPGPPALSPSQITRRIRHLTAGERDRSDSSAARILFPWIYTSQVRTGSSSGPYALAARE